MITFRDLDMCSRFVGARKFNNFTAKNTRDIAAGEGKNFWSYLGKKKLDFRWRNQKLFLFLESEVVSYL